MSLSGGKEQQDDEHESLTEKSTELVKLVNAARGQTTLSYSPLQGQTPPFQLAESSLLELLATLGHEFNTPLSIIEGYTSTLLSHRERLEAGEQDEFLQMIQQAGRRLSKLTEQLLEIAQLQAGVTELSLGPVDLSTLAQEAIKEAERQVPESLQGCFTFALHCRDALGNQVQRLPLVKGDVQRLHQILSHLLENAIQYSPTGGRIDVIARPAPSIGGKNRLESPLNPLLWAELCVCDFGIGIESGHLERIFDPFYRVDSGLTRKRYGLGLGLTVCKHLVALHQGHIWAESCPDGGCAFRVWLPFAAPVPVC